MSLIERVATALYDHCHEAEHGEVYENETEAGREYWNSFANAAIAAMPQLEAMQAEIDRRDALLEKHVQRCRDAVSQCAKWSAPQAEWSRARDALLNLRDDIRGQG